MRGISGRHTASLGLGKHKTTTAKGLLFGLRPMPNDLYSKRAYVLGDLHFNNHNHAPRSGFMQDSTSNRPLAVDKLDHILRTYEQELQARQTIDTFALSVILNGDIFDLMESWPQGVSPKQLGHVQKSETLIQILNEIASNNPDIMTRLKALASKPNASIHYVLGNHERWLSDKKAQAHLRTLLGLPSDSNKVIFSRKFYDPDLELMAVHGDQFDPDCRPNGDKLNASELFDILVLKKMLAERVPQELSKHGYSKKTVEQVQKAVKLVEYVRPLSQIFNYLFDTLSEIDKQQPQPKPKGQKPIVRIVFEETLQAIHEAQESTKYHNPKRLLGKQWVKTLISKTMTSPLGRKAINLYTSRRVTEVRVNESQIRIAKKFLEDEAQDKDIRVLVLGHTHQLLDESIGYQTKGQKQYCRLMNPGSYKATILYPNPDIVYPAGMVEIKRTQANPDELDIDFSMNQKLVIQDAPDKK